MDAYRSRGRRTAARIRLAGALALAGCALVPAAAQAADSITPSAAADPTESITTQLIVTGTTTGESTVWLFIKPSGGAGCAANPAAEDSDEEIIAAVDGGPYSVPTNWTADSAGSYLLCAYVGGDSSSPTARGSATISVRLPHLAMSIAAPATVAAGQLFQVTTTAQTEVDRTVWMYEMPDTGRGCPANSSAAGDASGADELVVDDVTGGPEAFTTNVTLDDPGTYLLCGYFPASDASAAAAGATVHVLAPCIVPAIKRGSSVNAARSRLTAAGCTAGPTIRVASSRYKAGRVLGFAGKAGTSLAPLAAVGIRVSTGPPCVVPRVQGLTLHRAERALAHAHCRTGKVSRTHARLMARGHVVRSSPRRGKRLATHARVKLVLSKGR